MLEALQSMETEPKNPLEMDKLLKSIEKNKKKRSTSSQEDESSLGGEHSSNASHDSSKKTK
jgi:hypothetical protein